LLGRRRLLALAKGTVLIFLAFFVPVAIYLLFLSYLNRSLHPVMVSGPWDFAGVLFATSGFLLLGGPAILTGLYEQWRLSWLLGQTRFLHGFGDQWYAWLAIWGVYFLVVLGGSVVFMWRRRHLTFVYNIELPIFETVLQQAIDGLGYEATRDQPRRLLLSRREDGQSGFQLAPAPLRASLGTAPRCNDANLLSVVAGSAVPGPKGLAQNPATDPSAVLLIEQFAALRHVTLHWISDGGHARAEIEGELARLMALIYCSKNPASAWFLSVSLGLFSASFFALIALVIIRLLHVLG
jgi:hypothetical protein